MSESFPSPFGRYQLTERLAIGGMAELFMATVSGAHGFKKNVVIKRILPHLAADDHFNKMFIDEAKITARLSHPKIAQTLELGKFNGQLYIAMEYVDGLDVLAMLRECAHRRTKIPIPLAAFIIYEVLDALDFAHNQNDANGEPLNIVHRDISPSNVLVSRRGDVKLVDFGIAQATEREQNTQAGTLKGKYGYMAPEQVVGGHVDARSDLFSAAIVLAEMAMGRRLFTAGNELDVLLMVRDAKLDRLDKYGKGIDSDLDAVLRNALRKDPDTRYQTAAEFRDALSEWMFEKRHRVTGKDLAAMVNELYDDAWERKRAQAPVPEAAQVGANPINRAVAGEVPESERAPANDPLTPATSTRDAIAMVAHDSEPKREVISGVESEPMVLIERTGADRTPVEEEDRKPSDIMLDLELGSPGEAREPAAADNQDDFYDLGDLVSELDLELDGDRMAEGSEPDPASRVLSSASASADSIDISLDDDDDDVEQPSSYTTQEIAFDDVMAAVREPVLQDESGQAIKPSDEELAQARQKRPSLSDVSGPPDDHGDLTQTPPLRVMCRLATAASTGLLTVSIGAIKKEIYIVQGRPEYVSSNVASELFGEYLVAQKVISDGELSMALAMMPHYGGKLGDTLVGLGLMKPLDVFRLLTRQVREKLIDVCTWSKGTFSWYEGRRNQREAFPLDLDPFEVLGAGSLAISSERIEGWCATVLDVKYKSAKSSSVSPESFKLGPHVREVYNQLDGTRTVGERAMRFTDDRGRDRFLRSLYLLVAAELAREA